MLEAVNISKSIVGQRLFDGCSLRLEPGTVTALIGPSGAGKTSLLRALSFVELPDRGTIRVEDNEYRFPMTGSAVTFPWPMVSMLFAQLWLWPHLTLRQNIRLPIRQRNSRDIDDYYGELCELCRLYDILDRFPNEVSQGERQRASIVRLLLLRPRYLILDEWTSSIDVETIDRLCTHFQFLKTKGVAFGIATHMLGLVKRLANRFSYVENGRIVEQGLIKQMDKPDTAELHRFLSYS